MEALTPRRVWYTPGASDALWGTDGTYGAVPVEHLPPIDRSRHDGSLDWLAEQPLVGGLDDGQDDDAAEVDVTARLAAATRVAAVPRSVWFAAHDGTEAPTEAAVYVEQARTRRHLVS